VSAFDWGPIDRALAAAVHFLRGRQSPDGAWRSEVYGVFREGDSLTPLVLHTLLAASADGESAAVRRGSAYLAALIRPDGPGGVRGLNYPAYTAALSGAVLSHPCNSTHGQARAAWLGYLKERQLTEALGWHPSDPEYGGWGYAHGLPRKPPPGQPAPPFTESNLSATVFALEALQAAGALDEPTRERAQHFLGRCQNYQPDPARHDARFDDGGFFFIGDDPLRNKAGVAGRDRDGRQRYSSYGSTTADGLLGLLACGLSPASPRPAAARQWLAEHFSVAVHPGTFAADRRAVQASVYYYYCRSLARALGRCGIREVETPAGPVPWAEALAEELRQRQRPDGSWVNHAVEVREDDPIVATALAAAALAVCRTAH
jgi:hypothetical protein